jgi:elongation factor Ts
VHLIRFLTKEVTLQFSTDAIKSLRERTGAGVIDCKNALVEASGDVEKANQILVERGIALARKKADRVAQQGLIESYIHLGGKIGSMVEVNCETDFVARTEEFKELAHNLALQIAAMAPRFLSPEEIPSDTQVDDPQTACLLLQAYIRDPSKTIRDLITETIAKVGENIKVRRFIRFELGY